ncbi:hypothetical protein [Zoogloea dura]|uniref:Uncharacterized protein n=1 Tax=Zoogloea dura TaxID=2728840 RepID=A0A848G9B0_9RHOO|nr:hypothetical protein [Zoogloea dura]NML27436.1 hypothetical protein [Zoogloea dura]
MPHISYSSPDQHAWAQPGEWDWTVRVCLIGSLLLGGSMLFPQLDVEHTPRSLSPAGAASSLVARQAGLSACVPDVGAVYRMIGHSAWDVLPACDVEDPVGSARLRP